MHLMCLGVMRKLIQIWMFGKGHLSATLIDLLSARLLNLRQFMGSDFVRLPRSLKEVKYWKATKYRQFLLYTGPLVLLGILPKDKYDHFCLLHTAIRILCCPQLLQHTDFAGSLLKLFVDAFPCQYHIYFMSQNMHNLVHLANDVKLHLDNFSAYRFENFYQKLKKLVRKASSVLQQLHHRLEEIKIAAVNTSSERLDTDTPILSGLYLQDHPLPGCTTRSGTELRYKDMKFTTRGEGNRHCRLIDGAIIKIDDFCFGIDGKPKVVGRIYQQRENFLPFPNFAEKTHVYKFSSLSEPRVWEAEFISTKYVFLPENDKPVASVGFPLLHTERSQT